MKKILILLVAMALVPGFAMAQGLGLTAGLEAGVANVSEGNNGKMDPWVDPSIKYDTSLMDGALDLTAKLAFKMAFASETYTNKDGDETIYTGVFLNVGATYHLFLTPEAKLSFGLAHDIDRFLITTAGEDGVPMNNLLFPSIRFGYTLGGVGELYAKLNFPINYLHASADPDGIDIRLEGTIGWVSEFGLGIWVREDMWLYAADDSPNYGAKEDSMHKQINFCVSYDFAPFYAEVEVNMPSKFGDRNGMTFIPKFQYNNIIEGLNAWVKCEIGGIAAVDGYDTVISPALGVTYAF